MTTPTETEKAPPQGGAFLGVRQELVACLALTVTAFDWNCPQHIPERFTAAQVEQRTAPLRERIRELEEQIAGRSPAGGAAGTRS